MDRHVKLTGARVALTATHTERLNLVISRGRILPFDSRATVDEEVDLSGHLLLPGLINAHDHLEFGLFPRLGNGPYGNASEWAEAIYRPEEPPVKEHLRVPKKDRLLWGAIRNLICGVTTVAHHNPWEPTVFTRAFPIRVVRRFGWAHSLHFSPDLADQCHHTPIRWPFIIHAAEGTDSQARAEVARLNELGVLTRRTVLVHAVGTGPAELETIQQSGSSIVWCPSSNLFTLGKTLSPAALNSRIPIALGTDSSLTAEGDMLDEMRTAGEVAGLTADQIHPLVTTVAARVLRLTEGQGTIRERGMADLVAVQDTGQTPAEALPGLKPELVMVGGHTVLTSERLRPRGAKGLRLLHIEGRGTWMMRADIPRLVESAAGALGSELRLGGKRILT